jgi:hypothetical protein
MAIIRSSPSGSSGIGQAKALDLMVGDGPTSLHLGGASKHFREHEVAHLVHPYFIPSFGFEFIRPGGWSQRYNSRTRR